MEWIKVEIEVSSDAVDFAADALSGIDIDNIEIEDNYANRVFLEESDTTWDYAEDDIMEAEKGQAIIRFYIEKDDGSEEKLGAIRKALEDMKGCLAMDCGICAIIGTEVVDDGDWLTKWKEFYKPLKMGKNLVIKPEWEDYPDDTGETVLVINPGNVFGTGQHESTKMTLEALEAKIQPGDRILDCGCGSGILMLGGLLLGAGCGVGIDIEPDAAVVVEENAGLNGIPKEKYSIRKGNILKDKAFLDEISVEKFDIVLANIIADVIIPLSPIAKGLVKAGGFFLSSGIIRERKDEVAEAITASGFRILDIIVEGEWAAIVAQSPEKS